MPGFSLCPPRPLSVSLPALHGRSFRSRWRIPRVTAYTDGGSSDDTTEMQMQALPGTEQQQDTAVSPSETMRESHPVRLSIERLKLSCNTSIP